jgi:colanic acid biosynthesis glycosyl transferase WcaI
MNILILVASYPPTVDSAAQLYSDLSESLREMGHRVTVISQHPSEDSLVDKDHEYYCTKSSRKYLKGVNVLRVSPLSFLSKIPGGKPLRFLLSCFLFAISGIFAKRPDVILVYSPPLFMGIDGYILSKAKKVPFVLNMQDIHPKVLFDSGVIKTKFIKRILLGMEEICYRNAYSFIVYSSGNRDYLLQRDVDGGVFIIPNWFDTVARVSSDRVTSFRNEELMEGKFVVTYAGSIQQAQGLEVVVETAAVLKEYNDIIFILAGEGSSKADLQSLISKRKVSNVLLRPVMPKDCYIEFLCASDICLIVLSSDIPLQTIPGKLAAIMACGRPVIAVVNQQGDAASMIEQVKCGLCVNPGDVEAFSHAVLRLRRDEGLRERMGRKAKLFAEQNLSRAVCTKQYEEVLSHAVRGCHFHTK